MKRMLTITAGLILAGSAAQAQRPAMRALELRPYVGANIPTGAQRDAFKDAPVFGLQTAMEVTPAFHVVGTFGWVPSHSRIVAPTGGPQAASHRATILQYDVGVELALVRPLGGRWIAKPFIGAGGGGRSYLYRAATLKDRTCASGYGALGMEFQAGVTALRIEARDNLFCFRSPIAGQASRTRNDLAVGFGLAYHFR